MSNLNYVGEVFGRPSGRELPWFADGAEADADLWAPADQSREEIVDLHRFSAAHSDATIEALDPDATGLVPWWPPERQRVRLHQMLVHMAVETARHAGHADIIRELIDGRAGDNDSNLTQRTDHEWRAYRQRLERAAEEAARR